VPEDELGEVARAAAERAGNKANPRPATADEIYRMFRSIY
jgi:alcohol dehydrogenase class IV